ncbi:MAG: HNH endonuclease [Saprospiraceae bacterium]
MVHLEKSQSVPPCLATEKVKASGDYKCGDVLERIKIDFKNKCYICEYKEPVSINVEHFDPHEGDVHKKFDWNNLFWSCSHCNNTKSNNFENILNCTIQTDNVETDLKYLFKPFPFERVTIEVLNANAKSTMTKELLIAVYNGTTKLKKIESANLRDKLLSEIMEFQKLLIDYFRDTNSEKDYEYFLIRIRGHLDKASNFTAFKRWIVMDNTRLNKEFGRYIN